MGPRLNLRLVKIEEGIYPGKVLHYESVHKTDEEIKLLEKKAPSKLTLKEQEANIAMKKAVREAKRQRKLERRKAKKKKKNLRNRTN